MSDMNARIKAAAEVIGRSVDALLSHLGDVVSEPVDVEVGTNGLADAIGVSCTLISDTYLDRRLQNLATAISGSQALMKSAAARGSRVMRVERGIGPKGRGNRGLAGVFSTLYHLEPRKIDDDIALTREIGIPPGLADQLASRVRKLGLVASTLRVTVYTGTPVENVQVELGAPAPANALDTLAIAGEETRFLRALSPTGTPLVWIGATPTGVLASARIEYLRPDFDEAIAIAGKFGEPSRVRSFVAALEARTIASIAVTLGGGPLGPAWLAANA